MADEDERAERLRSVQIESWTCSTPGKVFEDYRAASVALQYQKYELKQPKPLLRRCSTRTSSPSTIGSFGEPFAARREPEVNLFLKDLSGARIAEDGE